VGETAKKRLKKSKRRRKNKVMGVRYMLLPGETRKGGHLVIRCSGEDEFVKNSELRGEEGENVKRKGQKAVGQKR